MDCLDLQRKRASKPPAQARRAPRHFPHGNTEHDAHLLFPVIVLQWDRKRINGDAIESSRRDTSRSVIRIHDGETITRATDPPLQGIARPDRRDARVQADDGTVPLQSEQHRRDHRRRQVDHGRGLRRRHDGRLLDCGGSANRAALDERQRAAHAVRTCSASTFRPGRPSADFAGSGWRPIASQRTLPKSILVLAGSTCRLRSCGSARPPKSGPRARRWGGAPTRSAHSRLRSALPGRDGGE